MEGGGSGGGTDQSAGQAKFGGGCGSAGDDMRPCVVGTGTPTIIIIPAGELSGGLIPVDGLIVCITVGKSCAKEVAGV